MLIGKIHYAESKTSGAIISARFDKIETKVKCIYTNIEQLRARVNSVKANVKNEAAHIQGMVLARVSMAVKDTKEHKGVLENIPAMATCFRSSWDDCQKEMDGQLKCK